MKTPGVSLSVRWGGHELAREFLRLDAAKTWRVGTAAGVDFACPGAKALTLLEIDADGAAMHGVPLARGQKQELAVGGITFEAQLLDRPPQVKAKAADGDLAVVNAALVLLAVFGVFAVAAANAAAEGFAMDDELTGVPSRAVKVLVRRQEQVRHAGAEVAEAARKLNKDPKGPPKSPNHQARQLPISRPTGKPSKVDVGSIFKGPGLGAVFASSGLGDELKVASTGMLTAQQGNGIGLMGTGHGMDGNGLGGMGLQGIGAMGTKGGRGKDGFGAGPMLAKKEGPDLPTPIDGGQLTCETTGNGCLDKELIRRVIRANLAGFRYCYESLLNKSPNLEGKVAVKFSIAQSGRVATSTVASSTANNPDLEACVAGRVRLLQFPASKWSGMVLVTYPFIFKQSGR